MHIKGNGAVRPVKNKRGEVVKNSWQLILSLGNDPITGKRVQKCRHFKGNKTQAKRALDDFRREIECGLAPNADRIVFSEYALQWINARKASGTKAPATIKRDCGSLRHLNRHIGHVQLGNVNAPMIRSLYITLREEGLGESSIARLAIVLNQIMKQAVHDDILLRNPCESVEAPKQKSSNIGQSLNKEQLSALMKALYELEHKTYPNEQHVKQKATANLCHCTFIRLILATGLRHGEALGLSWRHVDFDNATLNVICSLDNSTHELKDPKTCSGTRAIVLDSRILLDLWQWKQTQKNYLNHLGIEQGGDTPVITNEAGRRANESNLLRWWRSFRKTCGLDGVRIHDLRHTHATMLVSSGLNIKAVSSRLGHSSVGVTLDLYAHVQREDDEKAATIIGDIINDAAQRQY
ncbi:tyrosine-type recombinase/integrase [Eggerthellaceae bacterium zg-887]|uniref:tyrosine-type recombinase/integrase n=1 Tax=Xiamenia xianingshaonis TaxID=2682776 RepID=UPI0013ED535C|nr:site-specific integrase [Xiamenia xianingshaonis]NGM18030.1 tyrosine-type recombinase/integrase [Eggerthellaceae bacterium zg-893]NHM16440.1 tyrosine-type recombinase/integrase [Xiamenia xianingshaonis]